MTREQFANLKPGDRVQCHENGYQPVDGTIIIKLKDGACIAWDDGQTSDLIDARADSLHHATTGAPTHEHI